MLVSTEATWWQPQHDQVLRHVVEVLGLQAKTKVLVVEAFHELFNYSKNIINERVAQLFPEPIRSLGDACNIASFFCCICWMADCMHHDIIASRLPYRQIPPRKNKKSTDFCGEDCAYLDIVQSSPEAGSSSYLSEEAKQAFLISYQIRGLDFCGISLDLGLPYTCTEVARYYRNNAKAIEKEIETWRSRSLVNESSDERVRRRKVPQEVNEIALQIADGSLKPASAYQPCHCEGQCMTTCHCVDQQTGCDIWCLCSKKCYVRWKGCRCCPGTNACRTRRCPCFKADRECSPDLCGSCGAGVEPEKRVGKGCTNTILLYGKSSKRLLLGINKQIQGWGLFAGEPIKKGEFIGEYAGEKMTESEDDIEATSNSNTQPSYAFDLYENQSLDGSQIGNKMRYANHSDSAANMLAKVKFVNGMKRIAFFASQNIPIGTELLFSYGPLYPKLSPLRPQVISGKK